MGKLLTLTLVRDSLPLWPTICPATRKSPCLTSGPTFVTLRPWKRTLSASDSGPTPRRAKSNFLARILPD